MDVKDYAVVAFAAVVFLAALVGLVVGVSTHSEPGFMFPDKTWDHPPTVSCRGYVEDRQHDCDVAVSAVTDINERLGFEMLRWSSMRGADIEITVGVPVTRGWRDSEGDARIGWRDATFTHCEVNTANTGTYELLYLTLYHELGHCLNLAHDPFNASIMRPVQHPVPHKAMPPRITDWDRALLRREYLSNF